MYKTLKRQAIIFSFIYLPTKESYWSPADPDSPNEQDAGCRKERIVKSIKSQKHEKLPATIFALGN
jgi:hypothetical protein